MTELVIPIRDERIKQKAENFCSSTGIDLESLFAKFVAELEVHDQTETIVTAESKAEIIRKRLEAIDNIVAEAGEAENELTDAEWKEFANIRSQCDTTRRVNL